MKAVIWNEWPLKELSPNARLHWAKKKEYKEIAVVVGFEAAGQYAPGFETPKILQAHFIFFPPNNRPYDLDNLLASMKSYIDGMFSRLGMDDKQIVKIIVEFGDVCPPDGCVCVELLEIPKYKKRVCARG